MSGWVELVVWWHVYPLGFVGAEPAADDGTVVHHRLPHLVDWLDYVVDLGANGIALGPVFASSTHGYDTVDHLRIDPRLGDRADFDALVDAAHARGLRVLLDGVFNHVGRAHPLFVAALAGGPEQALFRLRRTPDGSVDWDDFEGHHDLVALDHTSPAVADLVADAMIHWLDAGADGWRLDAAYSVPPDFWAPVLARVRAAHPDVYVVGEVIHGDYADVVTRSGMDAVTQYELWKAVWSAVTTRNWWELAWSLDRHSGFLDTFVPYTFVGNHDVTRIASQLDDDGLLGHALVVLLTVGGTPAVYAGDEQAFRGVKEERAGGDDAIRPAFPPTPDGLAPDGWWAYRLHQDLIGLRRRHPWLHRARTRTVELTNEHLLYETSAGDDRLLVALNLADDEAWLVDLPEGVIGEPAVLAGTATLDGTRVRVPGRAWTVLGRA